uniref:Large ribosomal subunit protein uL5c n=3 Tax=Ulva TaxID=3118 RepID=A0A8E6HSZ7_ULVCO|nr:50S ribosomal protein L5 [Ulva compressa]
MNFEFFKKIYNMERLKTKYKEVIIPKLVKQLNLKNIHQVPKISKIVINRGLGEAALNSKILDTSLNEISLVAGQRGVLTRSKKAIAAFKLRAKTAVGISVTLRGDRMYAFLDRFICLALPRIRDFQGINPKSFDGVGNYSLGLEEQLMFPEIDYDKIDQIRGMDISIITTAKTDNDALTLLKEFGMPFKKI